MCGWYKCRGHLVGELFWELACIFARRNGVGDEMIVGEVDLGPCWLSIQNVTADEQEP